MISNIASTYIGVDLSPHEYISEDDVTSTYVINTEYLKDIYNTQLSNICLSPTMSSDVDAYTSYTDHIFCLIVEISLFMIANHEHDIPSVADVVLKEPYEDKICIGDLITTTVGIKKSELMQQVLEPVYKEIERHLSLLLKKADNPYLIPLKWTYPDYKYLAIGELYE